MTFDKKSKEIELIYGNLLETIDVGFYQVTLDGQMLNHNRAHNIILGYDPSESLKFFNVRKFWQNPEDRDEYVKHLLKYDFTKDYICHALKKDGTKIIVELNSHLIKDENGIPIRIDGTFIDVTEKYSLQKKLEESEEKYRIITETAYDLIGVLNDKFEYEYINETAFQQILGYSSQDLIGKSALELTHPSDLESTVSAFVEGFKYGEGGVELRFRHKEGHWVWIEAKGKTFSDKDGKLKVVIISRSITDRKVAEKKYREAYNRANFYKDLFAHDINNILHIISSSMELISYHLGDSEKSKVIEDIANIINKQVERGSKLVLNVHTLSKLEEEGIHTHPVEIRKLMANAIDFIKKSYNDRKININIDCNEHHIFINANEVLQDVFENILLNAIKYNENSNVIIKIRISKIQMDDNKYYKIEFIDNGIGVPDERKQIIFKRITTELKHTKGMGLGLSLVKRILKSLNGKIWVEDKFKGEYTKGSNFVILLLE